LASLHTKKISMCITYLFFEKNGIIYLIRDHIKESILEFVTLIALPYRGTITTLGKNRDWIRFLELRILDFVGFQEPVLNGTLIAKKRVPELFF
jgi:hypothetical protein